MKLLNSLKNISGKGAKRVQSLIPNPFLRRNIASALILTLVTCLAALLSSCSDDLNVISGSETIIQQEVSESSSISIIIPKSSAEYILTRTGETNSESTIKDLWVFAFPTGTQGETRISKFSPNDSHNYTNDNEEYSRYTVNDIKQGTYHIFILGNIERYVTLPNGVTSAETYFNSFEEDSDITGLTLDFSTNYLSGEEIPMVCLYDEVRYEKEGGEVSGGNFVVEGNKNLYADLTFLCAKVRYSVFFDKKSFSNKFSSNSVDFDGISVDNVKQKTIIRGAEPTAFLSTNPTLTLSKVVYPDLSGGKTSGYLPVGENAQTTYEENLTPFGEEITSWSDPDQRAWQGIAYFPDNNGLTPSDAPKKTTVTLTPSEGSNIKSENCSFTLNELRRGNFYDVVAKLVDPNTVIVHTTIYVKVLPWKQEGYTDNW